MCFLVQEVHLETANQASLSQSALKGDIDHKRWVNKLLDGLHNHIDPILKLLVLLKL